MFQDVAAASSFFQGGLRNSQTLVVERTGAQKIHIQSPTCVEFHGLGFVVTTSACTLSTADGHRKSAHRLALRADDHHFGLVVGLCTRQAHRRDPRDWRLAARAHQRGRKKESTGDLDGNVLRRKKLPILRLSTYQALMTIHHHLTCAVDLPSSPVSPDRPAQALKLLGEPLSLLEPVYFFKLQGPPLRSKPVLGAVEQLADLLEPRLQICSAR